MHALHDIIFLIHRSTLTIFLNTSNEIFPNSSLIHLEATLSGREGENTITLQIYVSSTPCIPPAETRVPDGKRRMLPPL